MFTRRWAITGCVAGCILVLFILPYSVSSVRPNAWQPQQPVSLAADYAPNNHLSDFALICQQCGVGPEDITLDNNGALWTGLANGDIVKLPSLYFTSKHQVIANTGGRPLGLRFDHLQRLVVADADKGLIRLESNNTWSVLADTYQGKKLRFVDHLVIAQNGDIYFSDASTRFGYHDFVLDFIEASHTGRIFVYRATTNTLELLVDGLFFANGVALNSDQSELYINETGRSRTLKLDLTRNELSTFIDLPGMPDNLFLDGEGLLWISLIGLNDPLITQLASYPMVRRWIGGLPRTFLKPSSNYAMTIAVDTKGNVVHNLQADSGYTQITTTVRNGNFLYLGSLHHNNIAALRLPESFIKKKAPYIKM